MAFAKRGRVPCCARVSCVRSKLWLIGLSGKVIDERQAGRTRRIQEQMVAHMYNGNSPLFRISLAVTLSLVALALSWTIEPIRDAGTSLLLLLAAIVVGIWLFGWRPGLVATSVGALGHVLLVLLTDADFVVESIRLIVFLAVAMLILALAVMRQEAEESLTSSETQLRAILENSLDPIAVSCEGLHRFVNPAYLRMFGYQQPGELLGQSVLKVIAEDERATIQRRIEMRSRGEIVVNSYETRGLRVDGSQLEMEVHVSTYVLKGVRYSLVILRDITDRKRALREKEQLICDLRDALSKVKTLSGLLPTCAGCRKIRDEDGEWHEMENYISDHSDADFSHGLCPACAERLYPEVFGPGSVTPSAWSR